MCEVIISQDIGELTTSLERDYLLETDYIILTRHRPNKIHKIGILQQEAKKLISLSGKIVKLIQRYDNAAIKIEKMYEVHDDLYTKIHTYGGALLVDIRRYCTINDEQIPTKVGATIPANLFPEMMETIENYVQVMETPS